MDIGSTNSEMEMLHLGTHKFWDNEEIRTKFMDDLALRIRQLILKTVFTAKIPLQKQKNLLMMKIILKLASLMGASKCLN